MASSSSSSSSSSSPMKYHVFLSFRGEDTRLNFTAHLREALKDTGMSVFFDEEKLERGEELSPALSQAIAASRFSIIVLSSDYASSKSCLAELSNIMHRKATEGHIVLPIFYHVDPSHVRNLGGSFKKSFEDHESKRLHQVQGWKTAFAEVGKLKGWHIVGGKFDRSEPDYIKDVVGYVIKKLMSSQSRSFSEELVGIDGQKRSILGLIEQHGSRVIGLWGMGGSGKTTLADAVYKEVSTKFEGCCFLRNVREKIEKQGEEYLRNELLSQLLNEKEIRIDGHSIGSPHRERLKNKRVIVVLDDVTDSRQAEWMGVKHYGNGSKIIVTSRDRQVLKNAGAGDNIHKVEKLNEEDSLQLFSTFAFQQLNPVADFLHLSYEFLQYADGSPLAVKITGSTLYSKPREVWESEVHKLKQYAKPKISEILKISFEGLDELEKNIFLDIAFFYKWQHKSEILNILSTLYVGAVSGINSLLDKCLLDIDSEEYVSMHDMLEEMGKDIVGRESRVPGERTRLWNPKDVYQVLKHNRGTELIQGIRLDLSQINNLWLCPSVFENMCNLRYIYFYNFSNSWNNNHTMLHANGVDIVSLSSELRHLWWEYYPFKSLSPNFNAKNLVVLKLRYGNMEQLWKEDDYQVVNLRKIDVSFSKNLRRIPNLSGAINLRSLNCCRCESLVELSCLSHLTSLESLKLLSCKNLREIPNLLGAVNLKILDCSWCQSLVKLPSLSHLTSLETLKLSGCKNLREIPNLLGAINLKILECSWCESLVELPCLGHLTSLEDLDLSRCRKLDTFPELPNNLCKLDISETEIEEVPDSIEHLIRLNSLNLSESKVKNVSSNISRLESLQKLEGCGCKSLESLAELPPYLWFLKVDGCTSLEKVQFTNRNLYQADSLDVGEDKRVFFSFLNCFGLNQDSLENIETNAMLQIQFLAQRLVRDGICPRKSRFNRFICRFPGNEISANVFEHTSVNFCLNLKIAANGRSGSQFLAFAICLVPDFTDYIFYDDLEYYYKYQLTAANGEEFRGECVSLDTGDFYYGDHVLILSGEDLIIKDNDYEEASFDFRIKVFGQEKFMKVKKCGVHVFYVDAESFVVSTATKNYS